MRKTVILAVLTAVVPAGLALPALAADRLPVDLLVDLQPLRPRSARPEELAPKLRPIAALHAKQKWLPTCEAGEALRSEVMRQGARLLYAPDRFKGADVEGIERFLDTYVRGRLPLLELPLDVLVPAAPFRAVAVDACVRAERGDLAVPFVAEAAGAAKPGSPEGSALRLALAVAMAQRAGRWAAGAAVLTAEDGGVRALLLRALASADATSRAKWLDDARHAVSRPEDPALVTRVETLLKGTQPKETP